jgi:hypothetical protein
MKKLAVVGVVLGLVPALGLAVGNHPMAGCGLGYLLLSNKDNTKVTQVLGGTTNGTFGSQTFGISSGTSGCTEDGAVKFAKETETFVAVNYAQLQRDIAAGQGEYATAFATLLGAPEFQRPVLVSFLHANYEALFPQGNADAGVTLQALTAKLAEHPEVLG